MQINKQNIIPFIKYLYKKKTGNEAPNSLIESWNGIPESELSFHLHNMTEQWGCNDVQLHYEIEGFLQLSQNKAMPNSNISQPSLQPNPIHQAASKTKMPPPIGKSRNTWFKWAIILPIIVAGAYVGIEYYKFQNLESLYGVTDNIAIRNNEGTTVGRMDVFASKNAVSSLRVVNNKVYNIIADKEGNISESRKLILDSATFMDYLFSKEEKMVYINKNFLTNDKEYFEIQKIVFSEINKSQTELTQLKSNVRKVIIGSLGQDNELKQLAIKNSCNNISKDYSSILKHNLKDGKTITVICQLSNNQYYKLKGNPDENTYDAPVLVKFEAPIDSTTGAITKGNYIFKKVGTTYQLFDCNKRDLNIKANFDNANDITGFTLESFPIVTPSQDGQIF